QVALGSVALGGALAAHPERAPVGRARGQLEGHRRATQRRDLHLAAERRLVEGDGYVDGEVVVLAPEDAVRGDLHLHEQVAGGATVVTRSTLALEPDPRAVLDPGGDAGLDRPGRRAAPA